MGLSSKKTKTTQQQTQTVAPSAYNKPYIDDAAQTFKPAYDQGMAIQQQYQPGLLAAGQFYGDTLSGKYLDEGNPYLQNVLDSTNADITDEVNSAFMPRFGSGYHAKALANAIAANENKLRFGNYAQERQYQNDAGRNLAGVATTATALPSIPSTTYAQNVAGLLGNYNTASGSGTSTTKQSGGLLGDLLGAGLAGWASGGFKI